MYHYLPHSHCGIYTYGSSLPNRSSCLTPPRPTDTDTSTNNSKLLDKPDEYAPQTQSKK